MTRSEVKALIQGCIEDATTHISEDEIEEAADTAADKLCQELDEIEEDEDEEVEVEEPTDDERATD